MKKNGNCFFSFTLNNLMWSELCSRSKMKLNFFSFFEREKDVIVFFHATTLFWNSIQFIVWTSFFNCLKSKLRIVLFIRSLVRAREREMKQFSNDSKWKFRYNRRWWFEIDFSVDDGSYHRESLYPLFWFSFCFEFISCVKMKNEWKSRYIDWHISYWFDDDDDNDNLILFCWPLFNVCVSVFTLFFE